LFFKKKLVLSHFLVGLYQDIMDRRLEEEEVVGPPPTLAPTSTQSRWDDSQFQLLIIGLVQLVIIVLLGILLKYLLQMVNEFIDREVSYEVAADPFYDRDKGQAWNWDFVM